MTILPLIVRHWKLAAILALLAALWAAETRIDHWKAQATAEKAAHESTALRYRASADQAMALDLANVLRAQKQQQEISDAKTADYRNDLAALDARYRGLLAKTRADQSSRDGKDVPSVSEASSGVKICASADGLYGLALDADRQAVRLKTVLDWVDGQAGVE